MGFLGDYTKAKFLGASTDDAMKYAAIKQIFSTDSNSNQNSQQKYSNTYSNSSDDYKNRKTQTSSQNTTLNKNNKVLETLPLEFGELDELKKTLIFDDSNLCLNFQK